MELTDADILGTSFDGFTQVEDAVKAGRLEDVARLLTAMPWTATTALTTAIACHELQIAAYVISPQHADAMMSHAAYAAVSTGSEDSVSLLLKNGWDVNAPCAAGQPMLSYAVMNLPMVQYLLDKGADPNVAHSIDYTPLSAAVKEGNLSVVETLLRNGGDAKRGQLMHVAMDSEAFSPEMVQLLLRSGAPLDDIEFSNHEPSSRFRQDFPRGTPLHVAAAKGNLLAAKCLLTLGADPSKRDTRQRLAVDIAQARGNHQMTAVFNPGTGDEL